MQPSKNQTIIEPEEMFEQPKPQVNDIELEDLDPVNVPQNMQNQAP